MLVPAQETRDSEASTCRHRDMRRHIPAPLHPSQTHHPPPSSLPLPLPSSSLPPSPPSLLLPLALSSPLPLSSVPGRTIRYVSTGHRFARA
eukprot:1830205-Rhodomonas_salina.1